ncbi:MAG: hypothetical protein CL805_07130 [Citromicrobium sp.]|nr:hypothetical protein [Citromicrobium sp.]
MLPPGRLLYRGSHCRCVYSLDIGSSSLANGTWGSQPEVIQQREMVAWISQSLISACVGSTSQG